MQPSDAPGNPVGILKAGIRIPPVRLSARRTAPIRHTAAPPIPHTRTSPAHLKPSSTPTCQRGGPVAHPQPLLRSRSPTSTNPADTGVEQHSAGMPGLDPPGTLKPGTRTPSPEACGTRSLPPPTAPLRSPSAGSHILGTRSAPHRYRRRFTNRVRHLRGPAPIRITSHAPAGTWLLPT
jgi:hypothetical protein